MCLLRACLGSITALMILAGIVAAQKPSADGDLLEEAKRLQRVAEEKVEAEVRQALAQAERLAKTDQAGAIERLKKALAQIEDDTNLPAKRRESLTHMLQDRIRVAQADKDGVSEKQKTNARANDKRVNDARRVADQDKLVRDVKAVNQLREQGKTEEASRQAADLARQQPYVPVANASEQSAFALDRATQARRELKEKEKAYLGGHNDVVRSSVLPATDMEYPKDWKERTKGRSGSVVKLTEKEKAIIRTLNSPISVNFKNSKFEDVLEYIRTSTGLNIIVDIDALKDVEASYDTPVTLKVNNMTVRTVLRKVLADIGMTYVIKDEGIRATSAQKAKDMMVVRAYYIGDVLALWGQLGLANAPAAQAAPAAAQPGKGIPGFAPFGFAADNPQVQAVQNMQYVKGIMEMIENSVDPSSWRANGGNGTIFFHAASMSLIVKQSAEVHASLGSSGLIK
jgi:hypothetical protein